MGIPKKTNAIVKTAALELQMKIFVLFDIFVERNVVELIDLTIFYNNRN